MEHGRIRVVVADDVEGLRALLRAALEDFADIEVVGEAADGREAVAMATELRPDVVILDVSMPRCDGLEALPEIRRQAPGVAIVMFSGLSAVRLASHALRRGAHSYLEKGAGFEEIAAAVRDAAAARFVPSV